MLSALAAAHQAGMIHRDVKPENVLLADDGRVKVADFGLARAVSAETQHTATGGVLIGTVSYLSPELVVDGRADARSDVYAAGVVLYEMLTGRKPHEGDSPIQVAYKHVHEDVPPPSARGRPASRRTSTRWSPAPPPATATCARPTPGCCCTRCAGSAQRSTTASLDDPELTADLTPTVPVQRLVRDPDDIDYVTTSRPGRRRRRRRSRQPAAPTPTTRDPRRRDRRHRRDRHSAADASGAAVDADRRRRRRTRRPRSAAPAAALVLLLVVLLLAVGAGVGGWWFGSGRYASTPGVHQPDAAARPRRRSRRPGSTFQVGGRDYSETVRPGRVISTDPAGGDNVTRDGTVDRGACRAAPSATRCRRCAADARRRPRPRSRTPHLTFGDATYAYDDNRQGRRARQPTRSPAPRSSRDAAVDLVVSKGPQPVKVLDLTDKDADDATAALKKQGLEGDTTEENSDTVDRGRRHLPVPRQRQAVQGRQGRARGLQGPGAGRGARGAAAWAREPRRARLGGRRLRGEDRARPSTTSASGCRNVRARPGRPAPQGQHGHHLRRLTPSGNRPCRLGRIACAGDCHRRRVVTTAVVRDRRTATPSRR